MADEFSWLSWVIPTAFSTIMGVIIYINRAAFRRGSVETGITGKAELNMTMVTNAIKEIESVKSDIRILRQEIADRNILTTRLEERIKYIQERIDNIIDKMERTDMQRTRRDQQEDNWRRDHP